MCPYNVSSNFWIHVKDFVKICNWKGLKQEYVFSFTSVLLMSKISVKYSMRMFANCAYKLEKIKLYDIESCYTQARTVQKWR